MTHGALARNGLYPTSLALVVLLAIIGFAVYVIVAHPKWGTGRVAGGPAPEPLQCQYIDG